MKKHIGHDHSCHERFHLVGIDEEKGSVVLEYRENAWMVGRDQVRHLSYTEFLEELISGTLEIHRAERVA